MDDLHLVRIEKKLDDLAKAITDIARAEERINATNSRLDAVEKNVAVTKKDLADIAILARKNSGIAAFADKAFWLIVGGIVAVAAFFIRSD
jgi:ABC-type hemin transport system substrate-binding protein